MKRRCTPDGPAPDYGDKANWVCRPDVQGDACDGDLTAVEVRPDGTTAIVPHAAAAAPKIDCFYIYPTVDLSLAAGLHEDLRDDAEPRKTARLQAARLSEVCRIYAPLYRQVTFGTYLSSSDDRQLCFDTAYDDVRRAFEEYLAHDNQGRGFVVYGHSQGAQVASRLVRERIETDAALLPRLVAALPIGWAIGTDRGGHTGGSWKHVPICRDKAELGCAEGHRSYAAGNPFPDENPDLREGALGVCVHPGDVAGGGPAPLSRSYFPSDLDGSGRIPPDIAAKAPFTLYRNLYQARCVPKGDFNGLEVSVTPGDVRTNPINFSATAVSGDLGTHIYDVQFTLGDLIDVIGAKAAAYAP